MQIDDELLNRLQKLGMVEINKDKKQQAKDQISEILGFVQNLASVNTDNVDIQEGQKTPLRKDVPVEFLNRNKILECAPKTQDGFFVVPKIIE